MLPYGIYDDIKKAKENKQWRVPRQSKNSNGLYGGISWEDVYNESKGTRYEQFFNNKDINTLGANDASKLIGYANEDTEFKSKLAGEVDSKFGKDYLTSMSKLKKGFEIEPIQPNVVSTPSINMTERPITPIDPVKDKNKNTNWLGIAGAGVGLAAGIYASTKSRNATINNPLYYKNADIKKSDPNYSMNTNQSIGRFSDVAQESEFTDYTIQGEEGYTTLGKVLKTAAPILSAIPTPYTQAAGIGLDAVTTMAPLIAKDGMVIRNNDWTHVGDVKADMRFMKHKIKRK